ncbi:MAG TPA: zf-HC2 domain-containing protein [Nitrospiria bacterium]
MKKVKPIGCEEALKHLLTYLDQELGEVKSREVQRHLSLCRSCFSRSEFEQKLMERLKETGKEAAPGSLEKRIKTLLGGY